MTDFPYDLIRSDRKTLAVQIAADGRVLVRAPRKMPLAEIQRFLASRRDWILSHLERTKAIQPEQKLTEAERRLLAENAKTWFGNRVRLRAAEMGVTYGAITIRTQHTRWGSCSSKGNLNFNCLLMKAPEWVRDYVVVHELCHRIEMNHSPAFHALTLRYCPRAKEAERWLRENGKAIMTLI